MDNQNVKIEQSAGGPSYTRPGDVYHPDFDNGKPAVFDVSICNTGKIAEQGEMSKHLQSVERSNAVEDSFYPLVVETMGLWTPFALNTIATRASLRRGLSEKQAFKNYYNSSMVV